jgi:hypothetical protein
MVTNPNGKDGPKTMLTEWYVTLNVTISDIIKRLIVVGTYVITNLITDSVRRIYGRQRRVENN